MGNPDDKLFFAYSRVSTEEQAESRNGLEAQRAAIDAEAERRGWALEHFADEGASGKHINPNLREVLHLLANGQGEGLIVSKLDRLARSVVHAAVVRRIVMDCNAGLSFDKIATALGAEGILSPAGRPNWQPSTVRRIYQSATTATELKDAS